MDAVPLVDLALALFAVSFAIGIIGVLAGVGGGVLFVPIVGGFFPFHLDFVRAAGCCSRSPARSPQRRMLPRSRMASLRHRDAAGVDRPITRIAGAWIGLALPTNVAQIALGATILAIAALMLRAKKSEFPEVPAQDRLSAALGLSGIVP